MNAEESIKRFYEEQAVLEKEESSSEITNGAGSGEVLNTPAEMFEMIEVGGGTAILNNKSVTVSNFAIGKYPVTQAEWETVMDNNPCHFKGSDLPVEMVSWNECHEFIGKLNAKTGKRYRLPTEVEWEYAARGGQQTHGYKYAGSENMDDVGWYGTNSDNHSHSVGTKQPNELGIYDMCGNVWEWCSDLYGNIYPSSASNPTGAGSGSSRIARGGSWVFIAGYCRVSNRYHFMPDMRYYNLGFRLALSL